MLCIFRKNSLITFWMHHVFRYQVCDYIDECLSRMELTQLNKLPAFNYHKMNFEIFISCTDIGNNYYCSWIEWDSREECGGEALFRRVCQWAGSRVRQNSRDSDVRHCAADSIALWRRRRGNRLALPAGVHIGAATGAANTRTSGWVAADGTGQFCINTFIWVNFKKSIVTLLKYMCTLSLTGVVLWGIESIGGSKAPSALLAPSAECWRCGASRNTSLHCRRNCHLFHQRGLRNSLIWANRTAAWTSNFFITHICYNDL